MKPKPQFYVRDGGQVVAVITLSSSLQFVFMWIIPLDYFRIIKKNSFVNVNNYILFMNVSIYHNLFVDMHDIDSCRTQSSTIQNTTK